MKCYVCPECLGITQIPRSIKISGHVRCTECNSELMLSDSGLVNKTTFLTPVKPLISKRSATLETLYDLDGELLTNLTWDEDCSMEEPFVFRGPFAPKVERFNRPVVERMRREKDVWTYPDYRPGVLHYEIEE